MPRKFLASISAKVLIAALLAATAVVSSAGTMRCLLGLPMSACAKVEAPKPKAEHDCCAPKAKAEKPKNKCCCIDALKKAPNDGDKSATFEVRFDFPIIVEEPPKFEPLATISTAQQIRWPEIHAPPGPNRTPSAPRAPPAI